MKRPPAEPQRSTPLAALSSENQWLVYEECGEIITTDLIGEVLPALRAVEEQVNRTEQEAVGFVSYEAASAFDPAHTTQHRDHRLPLLWFGIYEKPQELPKENDSVPPFLDEEDGTHGVLPEKWQPSLSQEEYERAMESIHSHLSQGDSYQVNFTFPLSASLSCSPRTLFAHLLRTQRPRYGTYLETEEFVVCSASPELFFSIKDGELRARPMKGTAPRAPTTARDEEVRRTLCSSEKERAENIMIVDMIRNDISRIAEPGTVQVSSLCETERYPSLWQMTSTVEGRSNALVSEVFQALFPCASITGAPKVETMKIIAKEEPTPRGIYTGALGRIVSAREALFTVPIRTAVCYPRTGEISFGVGSGVTADSVSAAEYQECAVKASILSPKPSFSLFETIRWSAEEGFFLLEEHLERLSGSASYFHFLFSRQSAIELLHGEFSASTHSTARVRLELAPNGEMKLTVAPVPEALQHTPLRLTKNPVSRNDLFLFHKTTHRAVYDAAREECEAGEEPILWNREGEITETDRANIVIRRGDKLLTPHQDSGLLNGTLRRKLLREGTITEARLTKKDLFSASEILLINALRGWRRGILADFQGSL
ncbi:aminodeoxychorismate synthase component I [bacterium]|nr:aminodeoxychorismate synthase component I [bacterium]